MYKDGVHVTCIKMIAQRKGRTAKFPYTIDIKLVKISNFLSIIIPRATMKRHPFSRL
jgi:hypothetical protein